MRKLVLLGLLILISCSSNKKQLTTSEYMKLGVPRVDKVWRAAEYEKFASVLSRLKENNFYSLPLASNKNSAPIFFRVVSTENIDTLMHESKTRRLALPEFFTSFQKVLKLYSNNDVNDFYHEESTDLYIFIIKLSNKTLSILETIPNQSTSPNITAQRIKMINGYKSTILGSLEMQQTVKGLTENDLNKYSIAITESLNKNKNIIDEGTLNEIRQEINNLIDTTTSKALKANYTNWLNQN